jgi:hypothetical protein
MSLELGVVHTPVIPALGKLKAGDQELEASYIVRPCLRKNHLFVTNIHSTWLDPTHKNAKWDCDDKEAGLTLV